MMQLRGFGALLLTFMVVHLKADFGRRQHFLKSPHSIASDLEKFKKSLNPRQYSSVGLNWLMRNTQKPVFCKPDQTLLAEYLVKQPTQADFLDFRPTEEEKHLILDVHNKLRQKVAYGKEKRGSPGPQPVAAVMPDLKWDKKLADLAWEWAKHLAQNRKFENGPKGSPYGQNLGFSVLYGTSSRTWDWVIDYEWSYGVNHMNCDWVRNFRDSWSPDKNKMTDNYKNHSHLSKSIGRYTQMVWAETTHVGCAAIGYSFRPGEPVICLEHSGLVRLLYVCNYNPPGNIVGRPVYKVTSSSNYCPEMSTNTNGLLYPIS